MNLLPVAHRELRVLARKPALHWSRAAAVGVVLLLAMTTVGVRLALGYSADAIGRPLFQLFSWSAALFCLLAGPVLMADSIAEEKRSGTLGLLRLSNLHAYDVVAGKLAGFAPPAIHGLLAILPVMTAGFILGGVGGGEFARTALALLNLLFCSMALAAFCSALFASGRRALAVSGGCLLLSGMAFGALAIKAPWALDWRNELLALAAPVAAVPAGWQRAGSFAAPYARLLGWTHGMAWLCLLGTCVAVARAWRGEDIAPTQKPSPRWVPRRGGPVLRWLATRQVGSADWMWLYVAAVAGILWWLRHRVDDYQATLTDFALVAWGLHGAFKVVVGWTAVRALGTERDSGALEMLFVTPLGEVAVWQAWLGALKRRFLAPALALVAFDLWLAWRWTFRTTGMWSETAVLPIAFLGVLMFLLDAYALAWVGLWQGLVRRTSARATALTLGLVLGLPSLAYLPLLGLLTGGGLALAQIWVITVIWFGAGCVVDIAFGAWTMVRVSDDLREVVGRRG